MSGQLDERTQYGVPFLMIPIHRSFPPEGLVGRMKLLAVPATMVLVPVSFQHPRRTSYQRTWTVVPKANAGLPVPVAVMLMFWLFVSRKFSTQLSFCLHDYV